MKIWAACQLIKFLTFCTVTVLIIILALQLRPPAITLWIVGMAGGWYGRVIGVKLGNHVAQRMYLKEYRRRYGQP